MIKKYIANSHISISVTMPNGGRSHITFSQVTGGGSYFYTDDENLQKGLESHAKFGKLFKLAKEQPAPIVKEVKKQEPAAEKVAEQPKIKEVSVSCWDDAKDFLCEKFGMSRTKLRSQNAIKAAAEERNIRFVGI